MAFLPAAAGFLNATSMEWKGVDSKSPTASTLSVGSSGCSDEKHQGCSTAASSTTCFVARPGDYSDDTTINIVSWDGPDDPANPKNWSVRRKWTASLIVSGFAFLGPVSSSIAAPALDKIGEDLHITPGISLQLVLSIYLLTSALGPFVLAPCSEIWGRVPILRIGNVMFVLFTALCGFATSGPQITAFRFLAGVGGSASLGMGSGVLTDCWRSEERGRGIAIYQLAPVLGPAIGPIAGAYLCQYGSWRWAFWGNALFCLCLQAIAQFFLHETYPPRLLHVKAQRLRDATGDVSLRTQWEADNRTLPKLLRISLSRPWVLLGTQPIIQLFALYQAFNFGMLYLFISGFPALWEGRYGMPKGLASLNYISIAAGSLLGVNICGPLTDAIYRRLKKRHGFTEQQPGLPEFRIPLMIPASLVMPFGIFLFAWSAEAKLHPIVPNVGVFLYAASSIICYQCIAAYIADTYTLYSASASAACSFLRSFAAFIFPLFVPYLFGSMGYGAAGSMLGCLAIAIGIPTPILFWAYGQRLREWSRFAQEA
ncbi:major facilitator superfamily transporter [Podospora didyma]|uniref:Major facilitator superfamily transporter n=1 Tax=Podospora didyma TaxID=330526 RepID=A0AAE0P8C6_9PEZI|nr:major facilitator superfamily transporter [Podospora didyma]